MSSLSTTTTDVFLQIENLFELLTHAKNSDVWRLKKRLIQFKKSIVGQGKVSIKEDLPSLLLEQNITSLKQLKIAIEISIQAKQAKLVAVPKIVYPKGLPISDCADKIAQAIKANQVVIIAGETGSGKTTQIPKICLELGRGIDGLIGHTQPRRIAARTVANRIADELGTKLGDHVGYKVRFNDQVSEHSYIKLMTDGI